MDLQARGGVIASDVRRMVLFPFGQHAVPMHRSLCVDCVIRCNGDLDRFIDAPNDTMDRFGSHIARISGLREGTEQALVVLTRTNMLAATAIDCRQRLESQVPLLRRALWLIYVDPDQDPFFLSTARTLGELSGPLDTAPVWVGPGMTRFIVMSPLLKNLHRVAERVNEIERDLFDDRRGRVVQRGFGLSGA